MFPFGYFEERGLIFTKSSNKNVNQGLRSAAAEGGLRRCIELVEMGRIMLRLSYIPTQPFYHSCIHGVALIIYLKSDVSFRVLRRVKCYLLKDFELEGGSEKVPFILKKWSELESGNHEQVHELAKEISEMVAFPRVKRIEE